MAWFAFREFAEFARQSFRRLMAFGQLPATGRKLQHFRRKFQSYNVDLTQHLHRRSE